MNPLLVSGFGTSINVEKAKLIIKNAHKDTKYEFYPHKIDHDSIILDGHSGNITFDGIKWLMKHNIQLTILNWNGNLLGVTLPESPISGKLRVKQYQKYLDNIIRYEIAEKLVEKKIESSFNLLEQLSLFYLIDIKKIESTFKSELKNFQIQLKREQYSFSNLLTYEGRIAQVYFDNLRLIFNKITNLSFKARKVKENARNYNAVDEINALFNYGYAILESEIRKSINSVGLDTQIGFLHQVLPSRTPLVYDFQELFRWIVDYSVIQLLENIKLKKNNFILTENYHIRLKDTTASLLIKIIKDNFNKKVPYKGKKYYYHNVLHDNIAKLALFIADKNKKADFVVPKIAISRKDNITLQEKILKMTPDQRKKLGINKSTLWYMKKNLKSGKNIKIYDKTWSKINLE